MLSGGASRVDGFAEALQERFGAHGGDVRPVPEGVRSTPSVGVADSGERIAPTAAVAVGLALRRAGDR